MTRGRERRDQTRAHAPAPQDVTVNSKHACHSFFRSVGSATTWTRVVAISQRGPVGTRRTHAKNTNGNHSRRPEFGDLRRRRAVRGRGTGGERAEESRLPTGEGLIIFRRIFVRTVCRLRQQDVNKIGSAFRVLCEFRKKNRMSSRRVR